MADGTGVFGSLANSVSSTGMPFTRHLPWRVIRPAAGYAGATITCRLPLTALRTPVSAPTLPRSVESIFLMSQCASARSAPSTATFSAASAARSARESVLMTSASTGWVKGVWNATLTFLPLSARLTPASFAPVKSSATTTTSLNRLFSFIPTPGSFFLLMIIFNHD